MKCIEILGLFVTLGVYGVFCMLDESKAYLEPENQVRKVGDKGQFKCRSPAGYSSTSPDISFILEHNGTLIDKRKEADKTTAGKFSWAIFEMTSLKREDAGTYKCIIDAGGGKNVTAESKLFVIEDDHRPIFVKDGDSSTVKCFNSTSLGFVPYVECLWGDKKICPSKVSCCSIKAENENDPKPITCKVTTKAAFEKNKKFDNESSTELKKEVSVVSWNACEEIPCTLIANVYGLTAVQIVWSMAGESISSTQKESSSLLTSTTDPINITGVVLLTVSGGGVEQSWNISMASPKPDKEKMNYVVVVVLVSVVVVFAAIVLIVVICRRRGKYGSSRQRNRSDVPQGNLGAEASEELPLKVFSQPKKGGAEHSGSEETPLKDANNGGQPT